VGLLPKERAGGEGYTELPRRDSDFLGKRADKRRDRVGVAGGRAGHHIDYGCGVAHRASQATPTYVASPAFTEVRRHGDPAPGSLKSY